MCVLIRPQEQFPDANFAFSSERLVGRQGRRNPTKRDYPILFVKQPCSNPPTVSLLIQGTFTAVSPVRQRAAKNLFRSYLFNGYRRLSSQVGYWIVPVVLGAFLSCSPQYRSAHNTILPAPCRLFDIRMGQEVRRLPQQQGGTPCPLWRALNTIIDLPVCYSFRGKD